jgi:hypothetical protein
MLALSLILLYAFYPQGATAAPFDLTNWSVVQYLVPNGHIAPNAVWTLSDGNTVATQSGNHDPSIFLSDFTIEHATYPGITGTWRTTSTDNDWFGVVFGYQNRGQYYLFNWKLGADLRGMYMRKLNVPGGADPTNDDLKLPTDTTNMQVLRQNDIPWARGVDYTYHIGFTPTGFNIAVAEGNTVLEAWNVNDLSYTSGSLGFFNSSQPSVIYQAAAVPEPTSIFLVGIASTVLCIRQRSRKSP